MLGAGWSRRGPAGDDEARGGRGWKGWEDGRDGGNQCNRKRSQQNRRKKRRLATRAPQHHGQRPQGHTIPCGPFVSSLCPLVEADHQGYRQQGKSLGTDATTTEDEKRTLDDRRRAEQPSSLLIPPPQLTKHLFQAVAAPKRVPESPEAPPGTLLHGQTTGHDC
jgi:hypothetical protein